MENRYVGVILDSAIEKELDYLIPQHLINSLKAGMRVEVPIRGHLRQGYIFSFKKTSDAKNVQPISRILSEEVISQDLFELAIWMSKYYSTSIQKTLKCMVPTCIRKEIKPKTDLLLSSSKSKGELREICIDLRRKYPKQASVLDFFLNSKKTIFLNEFLKLGNISKSSIHTLLKKKILVTKKVIKEQSTLLLDEEFFPTKPKILTGEQKTVLNKISHSLEKKIFQTHLIYGITGSGKTEIYLQAIEKTLLLKKTAIMLVPEIALTSQTIEKFRARFKNKIAVLHHRRSQGERYAAWHDILKGDAQIVIGARSAIFSPLKNLGLIIVDEEHDPSYKQNDSSPTYHARNIAVIRGKITNCSVVLASATPSLESFYNAQIGKYSLSILTKRATKALLPKVEIVDMKEELTKAKMFTHFSNKLIEGIKKRISLGEQTLLFLNQRGFHRFLLCSNCSTPLKCKSCSVSLTYHKKENILSCHYCSFHISPPFLCPICRSSNYMQYKGFGTEHVERSLKALLPDVVVLRIDRDTTRLKNSHDILFKQFRSGKADVLIGTQMITKGLHFAAVTLVGVLNSDLALNLPDFRSAENVFQLITQVAGRAGRSELPGEVIIQTFIPNSSTIQMAASQDYLSFYRSEIESRKLFNYPPFSRIIRVSFSGTLESVTKQIANTFRDKLSSFLPTGCSAQQVIPSGISRIKDKYRFHFLVKSKNILALSTAISKTKESFKLPKNITLLIDVDPISTYF